MRFTLLLVFLLAFCEAFSQKDSAMQLKTIEVVVKKYSNSSVTPVQILNEKVLQQMSVLSAADAIRYFSGVQLKDYGGLGGLKTVNIRGMGTAHTTVFYDGLPIGNAQNSQVDLGRFSIDNLQQIRVCNAQNGNIFQPAKAFAAGASVYLETKDPLFAAREKNKFSAQIKTGSFGYISSSGLWQNKISHIFSGSLSIGFLHSDGNYKFHYKGYKFDTIARRQNGNMNSFRAEYALLGKWKNTSEWKVNVYSFFRKMGLPRVIVSNSFESRETEQDENIFIQSNYKKIFSPKYKVQFLQKYGVDKLIYTNPDIARTYINGTDTSFGALKNHYRQSEIYLSLVQQYAFTNFWNVSLSTDWAQNDMHSDMDRFPFPKRFSNYWALASDVHLGKWHLQGNLLAAWVKEIQCDRAGYWRKDFSPMLAFAFKPFTDKDLSLRGFYKKNYRLPTFSEMYYTVFGQAVLRPESAQQWDLGFSYEKRVQKKLQSVQLQADVYFNNVKDKIIGVPVNLFHFQMINLGVVNITGVNFSVNTNYRFNQVTAYCRVNYSYENAINVTDKSDIFYKHNIPYAPKNSGSCIANATYKKWNFNYSFIYTGLRYSRGYNESDASLPAWYTSDMALRRDLCLSKKIQLGLSFEVNNLFNQKYDVVQNYPMPGRNFRIGCLFNFFNQKQKTI